jgi:hypothetical protein
MQSPPGKGKPHVKHTEEGQGEKTSKSPPAGNRQDQKKGKQKGKPSKLPVGQPDSRVHTEKRNGQITPQPAPHTPNTTARAPQTARRTPRTSQRTTPASQHTPQTAQRTPSTTPRTPQSAQRTPQAEKPRNYPTARTPQSAQRTPQAAQPRTYPSPRATGRKDWECLTCNFINFASKSACFDCKIPKPSPGVTDRSTDTSGHPFLSKPEAERKKKVQKMAVAVRERWVMRGRCVRLIPTIAEVCKQLDVPSWARLQVGKFYDVPELKRIQRIESSVWSQMRLFCQTHPIITMVDMKRTICKLHEV